MSRIGRRSHRSSRTSIGRLEWTEGLEDMLAKMRREEARSWPEDALGRGQRRVVTGETLECVKSVSFCISLSGNIIYYFNMIRS